MDLRVSTKKMCSQLLPLALPGVCTVTAQDWNEVEFDHNTSNYRLSQRKCLSCLMLFVYVCSILEAQIWLLLPVGLCDTVERKYLAKGNGLSESQIKIICTIKK